MERKRRPPGQSPVPAPASAQGKSTRSSDTRDLVTKRKKLLESVFENGRQLAQELIREIEQTRKHVQELESDNARLRVQLKSDNAIRELLTKIELLEVERRQLLSRSEEVERQARTEVEKTLALETELLNLGSLYVACAQLHSTLDPREVVQTLGQMLLQFVGAAAYVVYVLEGGSLVPIASEGLTQSAVRKESSSEGVLATALSSYDLVSCSPGAGTPMLMVPLRLGALRVGVVAVHSLLEQKHSLGEADYDLLRMMSTQAATALVGSRLYSASGGNVPSLSASGLAASGK